MKNIFVKLSLVLMLITMSIGQVWADVTFSEGDILYVKVSAVDWWNNGGCKHYAALRSSSEGNVTWTSSAAECVNATDGIWAYKMPAGTFKYVLIVRGSKIGAWGYNNTGEIVLQTDKNYISKFEQNSATVTWGTYQLTSTASSTPSKTTVSEGEFVTFSSALTSNQTYNVVKSTGYSVTPGTSGTDWTIDNANNKVTFLKAGTYTVTARITYNAKGFANITKYADVQNTITVNAAAPVVTNYYIAGDGAIFGSWAADGVQLEGPVDGVYSKTFNGQTGGTTYKFKITKGTWDQSYNTYDQSKSANVTLSHVDKDNNVSFEIAADGNFTIYFDPDATNKIWVVGPAAARYTVTYVAGEGSGSMTDSNSPYEAGTEVTLLDNTFTAPIDKVFDSWQVKDASNNDVTVTAGKFTMPASNVTVTAQWVTSCTPSSYELWASSGRIAEFKPTDNDNEYELTFKLTDAIMNNLYVKDNCGNTYGYNGAINPGGSITLVKGLNFFRFESAAQNETWHYVFNSSSLLLSSDAQSEEKKNVTVTYDANGGYFDEGGNPTTKNIVEKYGTAYSKSVTPIRAGYNFLGWFTTQDGGIEITTVTTATAHSVYAHWEQIYLYVVGRFNIYDEEHDTWIKTTTSGSGWDLSSKNIPFTFNESTKKYELQTNAKPYDLSVNMNGYPQYFMVREGSASAANGVFYYEATGCQFNDSKTSTTLTKGSTSDPGSTYHQKMRFNYESDKANLVTLIFDPSNNQLSYTKTAIPTPTVTFDVNGGDALDPNTKNVTYRDTYGELPTPSKDGYHFDGWFTTQDGGTQVTSETKVTNSSDHTLYAHWTQIHVYIVGRFKVRSSEGGAWIYTESKESGWAMSSTNIEMPLSGSNYVLNTNASVRELSSINNDDAPGWFAIMEKVGSTTTTYYGNAENLKADNKSVTLSSSQDKHVKFNDKTDNSQPVILTYNPTTHVISYTATAQSYALNFSASSNGTLTATANEVEVTTGSSVEQGSAIVFTATPEDGYYLSAITKDGEGQDVPERNDDGTYTINTTMGGADETWAATFEAITATPHVNSDAAIVQTGETATVRLTYTPVIEPKGDLTFCYSLYKNNAGAWNKVDDIEFTEAMLPSVTFTAPMEEGTYRVGVVMHQGATCEGAAVGEEQYSSEFRIANVYTVTYGQYPSAKATLTATVSGESIGASPAEVSAGSTIVFTVSNIASKYAVQGWYADAECTMNLAGATGYVIDNENNTLTITSLSRDESVYVKFYSPSIITTLVTKDKNDDDCTAFLVDETIKAIATVDKGHGDKAYCWTLLDANNQDAPVSMQFTSIGGGNVKFVIKEAGTYKLRLDIHDTDCQGEKNSSMTTAEFKVGEHVYYIVGDHFWGSDASSIANLDSRYSSGTYEALGCGGYKDVHLQPTLTEGEYYFGPWQYGNDYNYFWIYDAAKKQAYSGGGSGYYTVGGTHSSFETGITLVPVNIQNGTSFYTKGDDQQYTDLGQNGHNWHMYIRDGKMWFTESAPDLRPATRLKVTYTDAAGDHTVYSNEVKEPAVGEESEIISFFAPKVGEYDVTAVTYTMQEQKVGLGFVDVAEGSDYSSVTWENNVSVENPGVYTAKYTWSYNEETKALTLNIVGLTAYTGNYYVRSKALNGGYEFESAKAGSDNLMRVTDRAKDGRFDRYVCKWCASTTQNVRCLVANDYNPSISEELVGDDVIGLTNETLQGVAASVRFSWNSKTNNLFRAYLEGTISNEYLKLYSQNGGYNVYTGRTGDAKANNVTFADLQDWNYTIAEVYAELGSKVAVRAKYKNVYQFFYGAGDPNNGDVNGYDYLIGSETSQEAGTRYRMRIIYDFKVDRLVCGWIPDENDPAIEETKLVNCDILIIRQHNDAPNIIKISPSAGDPYQLQEVKTVYGVFQINKDVMTDYTGTYPAEKQMYWISFPFDVRVREIFGIDGYGTNWKLQKYNGQRRADIGWFQETETFWEDVTEDEILSANQGYLLNLNKFYFRKDGSGVWQNGLSAVSLYFPSASHVGTISTEAKDVVVPSHECHIDRTFTVNINGEDKELSHTETDSHWNIIGVPTFQPVTGNSKLIDKFFYEWTIDGSEQKYIATDATSYTFNPLSAYMTQFEGELNWEAGSTPIVPQAVAARHAKASIENNTMDIRLMNNSENMLDRTYLRVDEDASNDFVLNEDMYKVDNAKFNIFTRTKDGYGTGANVMPLANDTVELGIMVSETDNYTIRLQEAVDFDAVLIDRANGEAVDLNVTNFYSVELERGIYNGRFAIVLAKSPAIVTGETIVTKNGTIVKKYLKDGVLYVETSEHVYDGMGHCVK